MTNHRPTADHNICGSGSDGSKPLSLPVSVASRRSEAGYTLVALLAMMTVLALFAMAVAPSAQQQATREREQEAIFRGEQVADAIRDYYRYRSEEHTSELQSQFHLVCRLLLEKKKKKMQ